MAASEFGGSDGVSVLLNGYLNSDGIKLPATAQWTSMERLVRKACERMDIVASADLNTISSSFSNILAKRVESSQSEAIFFESGSFSAKDATRNLWRNCMINFSSGTSLVLWRCFTRSWISRFTPVPIIELRLNLPSSAGDDLGRFFWLIVLYVYRSATLSDLVEMDRHAESVSSETLRIIWSGLINNNQHSSYLTFYHSIVRHTLHYWNRSAPSAGYGVAPGLGVVQHEGKTL